MPQRTFKVGGGEVLFHIKVRQELRKHFSKDVTGFRETAMWSSYLCTFI